MNKKEPAPTQDLVVIPQENALAVFTQENALDPYVQKVQEEIDKFVPDVTTVKGREAIASIAYKVAKVKTYLESVGKDLAAEQKKIPALIDAARRQVWEKLEQMQKAVRKPLTDWEEAEEKRKTAHQRAIQSVYDHVSSLEGRTVFELEAMLSRLGLIERGKCREEFSSAMDVALDESITKLIEAIDKRKLYEAEQAELAELRRQKAEREAQEAKEAAIKAQAERDEMIRQEAAQKALREEQAKAEAARRAEADRITMERQREQEAIAQREAELERERIAVLQREAEHKLALEQAELARIKAENDARETEARIKREQEEAQRQEAAETARREANTRHKGKIHSEIKDALLNANRFTEEQAKIIVMMIAKGEIPHVSISY